MVPDVPFFIILTLIFMIGITIGSFLNVLIDRLPRGESIMGRSYCEYCKHKLSWFDLFPLVSCLMLSGRCRYCNKKIPLGILFIELLTGVLFMLSFIYLGNTIQEKALYLVIVSSLIVVFFADVKYMIIPDSIQLSIAIASFLLLLIRGLTLQILETRISAAVVTMLPLLIIYKFTKGKGMGFGDVKLALTIGLLFGLFGGALVLYIAFVTGSLTGLLLIIVKRKKLKQTIAFGPFLVIGITTMLFWGNQIVTAVKKWYGF